VENSDDDYFIDCVNHKTDTSKVFFVSPGQCHSFRPEGSEGFIIAFKPEFYLSKTSEQRIYDFPFFHSTLGLSFVNYTKGNNRIDRILNDMLDEFVSNFEGKEAILRSSLEILMTDLARIYTKTNSKRDNRHFTYSQAQIDTKRVRLLENLIDQHFIKRRDVSFYADKMNISSRHLNSIVKEGTGYSISDLVQARLLSEAKRMLLYSSETVAEISWSLNFSDKAYFHRIFKKKTNYTPEQFRNKFLKVH